MKSGQIKALFFYGAQMLLGDRAPYRMLLARAYRSYEQVGVIFIHVPKSAGTSVSRALYGHSLGHRTAEELRSFAPDRFDRLYSFAVLRDPLERAHSAYLYLVRGGTRSGWVEPRPEYEEDSFANFERFATEWLPGRDPRKLDYVLQPQSRFVTDAHGCVMVTKLISVDGLRTAWPEVTRGRRVAGHGLGSLNVQRNKPPLEASEAAKEALREFYAADVALWDSIQGEAVARGGRRS